MQFQVVISVVLSNGLEISGRGGVEVANRFLVTLGVTASNVVEALGFAYPVVLKASPVSLDSFGCIDEVEIKLVAPEQWPSEIKETSSRKWREEGVFFVSSLAYY